MLDEAEDFEADVVGWGDFLICGVIFPLLLDEAEDFEADVVAWGVFFICGVFLAWGVWALTGSGVLGVLTGVGFPLTREAEGVAGLLLKAFLLGVCPARLVSSFRLSPTLGVAVDR